MRCDDARLGRLLATVETEAADDELTAHLSGCSRCQSRLLELAGDASWWQEARDVLRDGMAENDIDSVSGSSILVALDSSLSSDLPATCEPLSLEFLSPPSHPEMLGRLGRYEIERVIGSGGMGVVLKGFDTELHRPVGIKVLVPHLAGSGAARARFAREAQAAAAIVHDHVLPIHNVESNGKLPYLVMPYIAGSSLQARLDEQGPLQIKDVIRIALQSAQGLSAAHAQGIVHRDVKPANILLEDDVDRVRISDFGLARAADDASVTRSGILAGTPQYMSPEQTRGEPIDHRSDLFSLGSVIYAMCTGRPPFRADTTMGLLRRISDSSPRPLRQVNSDVPDWLEKIVQKLLAKSPADRFTSAAEVAELLEQCLAHLNDPAVVPLPAAARVMSRRANRLRRNVILSIAAGTALVLLVVLGFTARSFWSTTPAATEGDRPSSGQPSTAQTPVSKELLRWDDDVAQGLAELEQDTLRIEVESESLLASPGYEVRQEVAE